MAGFAVATVVLVALAARAIPPDNVCPDFIQFWTAAELLVRGQNPYDPALQAAVQQGLGWQKAVEGLGVYDFLPYYYPPWLGLMVVPLLPLGWPLAKLTWLVLAGESLVVAALLLGQTIRGVSLGLALLVVVLFGFSIKAVAMGQVSPFVLLFVAAAWKLLDERRDVAAGCVLVLLTIKPQLTLVLVAVLLAWCVRMRRPGVLYGFAGSLALVSAASTLAWPGWVPAMLAATRVTPMPTFYFPGLGATWHVALSALGLAGLPLYVATALAVVPLLMVLVRMALREQSLDELFAVSLIAPFFLAPYARPYDFPVLVVPALTLMGSRLPRYPRALLAIALTILVGLHILWMTVNQEPAVVGVRRLEFTYFWIPLMVAIAWLYWTVERRTENATAWPPERPVAP